MYLLKEINQKFSPVADVANFHCKLFEDNAAALEMARVPKMRPCTRHLNVAYHHFHQEVLDKSIMPLAIPTTDQQADILTKPVDQTTLLRLRKHIMGW